MDEEPIEPSRQSGFIESVHRSSSVQSLDDRSESMRQSSVHNKRSLVQVMSIDGGSMHDDIYEYYLIDDVRQNRLRNNSNTSQMPSVNENSIDEEPVGRRRSSTSRVIGHECQCDDNNCLGYHCPCYNEPNEMCLLNTCCQACVKIKNELLLTSKISKFPQNKKNNNVQSKCICTQIRQKGENMICTCQNLEQSVINDKEHGVMKVKGMEAAKTKSGQCCSCKKSHCLKKYCLCFAANRQCSAECECEECHNKFDEGEDEEEKNNERQRYGRVDSGDEEDIDQYIEDKNYEDQMMPQSMEFEHPDLKNSFHHQ